MEIIQIEGCTRVIGESQGYLGLPLRDIVIDDTVNGTNTPAMESAWQPSPVEVAAINSGAAIVLTILGSGHPPVMLRVDGVTAAPFSDAARDVLAERARQISAEGWAPEHDDAHAAGQLADAAAAYAENAHWGFLEGPPNVWPWEVKWWKPGEPRRMLVKAGALILAEIERIDRNTQKGGA